MRSSLSNETCFATTRIRFVQPEHGQTRSILLIGNAGSTELQLVVHRHVQQVLNIAHEVCLVVVRVARGIDGLLIGPQQGIDVDDNVMQWDDRGELRNGHREEGDGDCHIGADHVGQDDDRGGTRSWLSQRAINTGPLGSVQPEVEHELPTVHDLPLVVVVSEGDTNSWPRGGILHEDLGTTGCVCIIVGLDDFLHEVGGGVGGAVAPDGDLDLADRQVDGELGTSHGRQGCR